MIRERRSACPINRSVELLGDRWSLVILRDVAFLDHRRFRELLTGSQEGITAPVLSSRLKGLVELGLLSKADAPRGTVGRYSLTAQGVELVPLLFELAHAGSLLDPTTQSSVPGVADMYGDEARIRAYMDGLRRAHLDEATARADQCSCSPDRGRGAESTEG